MIRINLLPVRAAKKKESVRFQLTLAGLITFLVAVIAIAFYFSERSEAKNLAAQISAGQQELEELKKKIGELSRIKEQKRVVEEKLKIIKNLEDAKTGPVDLFRMISLAIPEKSWISTLRDEAQTVIITGFAANEDVVADFMRGLQKSKDLSAVELDIAQRTTDKDTGADVVGFTLRLERAKDKAAADKARAAK